MQAIIVSGTAKEIAALALEMQERQASEAILQVDREAFAKAVREATRGKREED